MQPPARLMNVAPGTVDMRLCQHKKFVWRCLSKRSLDSVEQISKVLSMVKSCFESESAIHASIPCVPQREANPKPHFFHAKSQSHIRASNLEPVQCIPENQGAAECMKWYLQTTCNSGMYISIWDSHFDGHSIFLKKHIQQVSQLLSRLHKSLIFTCAKPCWEPI